MLTKEDYRLHAATTRAITDAASDILNQVFATISELRADLAVRDERIAELEGRLAEPVRPREMP